MAASRRSVTFSTLLAWASVATHRLGDWSTDDRGEARMRARRDAVALRARLATFVGETAEQAVRGHWDSLALPYSAAYLALVVEALDQQNRGP
jgi:hypothetical protein